MYQKSKEKSKARWHVSAQDTLAREYICKQGNLKSG